MKQVFYIESVKNYKELLYTILVEHFHFNDDVAYALVNSHCDSYFSQLLDSCYLVAETNYVDKVYRDSYYTYYSSKGIKYERNSVKIGIFTTKVDISDFRDAEKHDFLRVNYGGFIVLRPTYPKIFGRSLIGPKVLKNGNFYYTGVKINTTCLGVKLDIVGFPHMNQDIETMTCAETTVWAMMEYFGNKYPEYTPTLPSKIHKSIEAVVHERQIPSKGLALHEISYCLKKNGFGTLIYRNSYPSNNFYDNLTTYIESGIPVVTALEYSTIKHATICVGFKKILNPDIEALSSINLSERKILNLPANFKLFDWSQIVRKFVFIDDNFPPYQFSPLDNCAQYYPSNTEFQQCKLTYFIVPLYPKIYLEVNMAREFLFNYLFGVLKIQHIADNVLTRFYLASARSYRNYIASNEEFEPKLKNELMKLHLPKFIWVCELSTKDLMMSTPRMANGLIILDATEANTRSTYPIRGALFDKSLNIFDSEIRSFKPLTLDLQPFKIYENNLNQDIQ